jgi:hypothetical protein
MKKIYSLIAGLLLTANLFAQAPQKMSYQAVIRNSSSALVTSSPVGIKISVLQGSANGTVAYAETQTISTNANGLVSLEIGSGLTITGTFAAINWANGPYFIKTETDPTGGTTYTIAGTSQLLSVPYALFAANSTPGPQGAQGIQGIKGDSGAQGLAGPAGTNAEVGGFTHFLGEAYLGGRIYYLYKGSDGLEHGLIEALTESTAAWQTFPSLVYANRTEDGAFNTNLMTGSPAKTYIATLGTGWYLPSIDELALLYYNRFTVQKALRAGSNTLLNISNLYWSSTEANATDAYTFSFGDGYAYTSNKAYTITVRGVRAF